MVSRQLNLMTTADPLVNAYMAAARVHYPDDTRRLLLRTFVAHLAAATKICPQPRQNAAAAKRTTNMASSDTDELECYYQALLWSAYVIGQTIILLPCDFYLLLLLLLLLFSSPNLSCRRLDVCHTSTHGVALVRI